MSIACKVGRLLIPAVILLSSGCVTTAPAPAEQIVGSWQSTLAGFTVTSTYSAKEVSIDGHEGMPYTLDGSQLVVGSDEMTVRVVSFPAAGEMIQLDPLTDTRHRFVRAGD